MARKHPRPPSGAEHAFDPGPSQEVLDLVDLAASSFQNLIKALEAKIPGPGWTPGTTLTRIILENKVAESYGLSHTDDERGAAPAWCLALGRPGERHVMFYGWDIKETVERAAKELLK